MPGMIVLTWVYRWVDFSAGPEMISGSPGFVDEDGVHLIHNGKVQVALGQVLPLKLHVVPEVVKPEFIVCTVGDVRTVGGFAFLVVHIVEDHPHGQPQEIIDFGHPFCVSFGQVIVHRYDVDSFAAQGVKIGGQGGHQGFTFTGFHFSDGAVVQRNTADKLHVKVAHAEDAHRGFPDKGEGFGQEGRSGFLPGRTLF